MFGTYADIIAYTQGDITLLGDKLGNSSAAPERVKRENQEIMLFLQYLFQKCQKCTSRNNGLYKTYGLIAWFVI